MQGQLAITNLAWCNFVTDPRRDIWMERIWWRDCLSSSVLVRKKHIHGIFFETSLVCVWNRVNSSTFYNECLCEVNTWLVLYVLVEDWVTHSLYNYFDVITNTNQMTSKFLQNRWWLLLNVPCQTVATYSVSAPIRPYYKSLIVLYYKLVFYLKCWLAYLFKQVQLASCSLVKAYFEHNKVHTIYLPAIPVSSSKSENTWFWRSESVSASEWNFVEGILSIPIAFFSRKHLQISAPIT